MKSFLITFAAFFTICAFCLAQDKESAKHKIWKKELGSEDYQTRLKAMEEVWQSGEAAIMFLKELADSEDPELAIRAAAMVQKIELGISPDTPQEVVDLIDDYLKSEPRKRFAALERLRDLSEFGFILKLRRKETNQKLLEQTNGLLMQSMAIIVRSFLTNGDLESAKEVLSLSDQFKHLIQLGSLLKITGGLEEELEKLAKSSDAKDSARYLAYLRVKGDAGLLRREAKRLGDRTAEVLGALVDGDHIPYFEYLMENGPDELIQGRLLRMRGLGLENQHYIKWALANHRGDTEAQKKAFEALDYLSKRVDDIDAQMYLFRMGYGQDVIDQLGDEYLATKLNYYLKQENYTRARELIGLPEDEELDQWIKETGEKVKVEIENSESGVELDRMIAAAEFLEGRGMTEAATKCVLILFDLARGQEEFQQGPLGRGMFYSAPVSVLTAVAREIEEHDADQTTLLTKVSGMERENLWILPVITDLFPKMALRERLLHTFSFYRRHLIVPVDRHNEVFEKLITSILESQNPKKDLANLSIALKFRNRESELLRIIEAQDEIGSPNEQLKRLLVIDSGRLDEGAKLQGEYVLKFNNPEAVDLYQYGVLLNEAGKENGEDYLRKAELYSDGDTADMVGFASQHQRFGQMGKSYEFLRQALLRSQVLPAPDDYSGIARVLGSLAAEAGVLGKWQEALAYREVVALIASNDGIASGVSYLRNRFQILVARGALAMEQGDVVKAASSFSEAHSILPRDGYLANELFPVMREVGLSELHDQLFYKSARYAREVIEMFPKDDNAYNNFAWMASRANRCLDEAEEYLKLALEMNPQSAAYLDTMGEIYFARRDRKEAIKWSILSIQNQVLGSSMLGWELHQQNQRFQSGDFPKP